MKTENTIFSVVVGMEISSFAGRCDGCGMDAVHMSGLLSKYASSVKVFLSEQARKDAVKKEMQDAASNADLFIFYYSGHGGQGRFWDTGAEEDDGMDEYLCLYDQPMRDNEVWDIITKCNGRVLCIFDACHSKDLYRTVSPISLKASMPLSVTHREQGPIDLLVWSGCPANTVSYGSADGGKMTNTLLSHFNPNLSYDALWDKMERDENLKRYEIIQRTIMGRGFEDRKVFT